MITFYYTIIGNRTMVGALKAQADNSMTRLGERYAAVLEDYRHRAYVLSTDETIVTLLKDDNMTEREQSAKSSEIYAKLFSIMKGVQNDASAIVVSNSGNVRYSTHAFPDIYDLRFDQHETRVAPFYFLNRRDKEKATFMTTSNRYITDNNSPVGLNVQRKVFDENGKKIGYVSIDIYLETLLRLVDEPILNDLILIDTTDYTASSIIHAEVFGNFGAFPALSALKSPYEPRSYVGESGEIVSLAFIPNTQLILAGVLDTAPYRQSLNYFFIVVCLVFAVGLALAGVLAYFFSNSIAKPVNQLVKTMQVVETGYFNVQVTESHISEIAQLDASFNTMVAQIVNLMELTQEEEEKLREAERKALESQMNPHFLYNTLNTIKAIAKLHDEQEILAITTRLGKLLRETINNQESEATIRDSLALVEDYLTIQKIRFGEKLHTRIDVDAGILDVKTPKLLIQPLVENAIIHGLEPKIGDWKITIRGTYRLGMIKITISDNGVGFPPGTLPENLDGLADSSHVGVYNVYRRIKLKYGDAGSLRIISTPGSGTLVVMAFPARTTSQSAPQTDETIGERL
jgi:two-component system sensor histidine kinase YesM